MHALYIYSTTGDLCINNNSYGLFMFNYSSFFFSCVLQIVEMCVHMDCPGCETKIKKALKKLRGT